MTPRRWRPQARIAVPALLAFAISAYQLTRPGLLLGMTPDIAAWFGASVRLVHGSLPYRDFVLTQPPGFTVLASPFALLSRAVGTRDALAVLRASTPLLAATVAGLTAALVRHRGAAAAVLAGGVVALFPAELYGLRSGLLEPVVTALCLASLVAVFDGEELRPGRRRALTAGVCIGLAITVKMSAVVPLLALLLAAAVTRPRIVPWMLAGTVGAYAVVSLPFAAFAPSAFVRDTIRTQIARIPASGRTPLAARAGDATGVAAFVHGDAAILAAALCLGALAVAGLALRRRRLTGLERFAVVAALAVLAAQLGPAWYYPHYAALAAPFVALLLGVAVPRRGERAAAAVTPAITAAVTAALAVAAIASVHGLSAPDVAATVGAAIPAGTCTVSDGPKFLVTSDRFVASGCDVPPDPQGMTLALGDTPSGAAAWRAVIAGAGALVSDEPVSRWDVPGAAALQRSVDADFRCDRGGGLMICLRVRAGSAPS